jgi:hypothetical protein
MKLYTITKPFAGYVTKAVEADSEEEAIAKFNELVWQLEFKDNVLNLVDHIEYDFYDKVVEGNICYLDHHEMEIEIQNEDAD